MTETQLLPRPQTLTIEEAHLSIDESLTIVPADTDESEVAAARLQELIEQEIGLIVRKASVPPEDSPIVEILNPAGFEAQHEVGSEYRLAISGDGTTIEAASPAGLEYAAQSFVGLIRGEAGNRSLPACEVHDWASSTWRGVMLDPARGYIPVDRVKRVIDGMARAKLNILHLGLLNAESCAIEVPAYPHLTNELPPRRLTTQRSSCNRSTRAASRTTTRPMSKKSSRMRQPDT